MKSYRKTQTQLMFPWTPDTDMTGVSISEADRQAGSPKEGDMIALNTNNISDRWLIEADFFNENYVEIKPSDSINLEAELEVQEQKTADLQVKLDTLTRAFFGFATCTEPPSIGYQILEAILCETDEKPTCDTCENVLQTYLQITKITPNSMQRDINKIVAAKEVSIEIEESTFLSDFEF